MHASIYYLCEFTTPNTCIICENSSFYIWNMMKTDNKGIASPQLTYVDIINIFIIQRSDLGNLIAAWIVPCAPMFTIKVDRLKFPQS